MLNFRSLRYKVWDNILYFLYANVTFFYNKPKLHDRFFWKDFKRELVSKEHLSSILRPMQCVIAYHDSRLEYISEFLNTQDELNKVYKQCLIDYARSGMGIEIISVNHSRVIRKLNSLRKALKRFKSIELEEIIKPKKRGKTKNVKTRRRSRRSK